MNDQSTHPKMTKREAGRLGGLKNYQNNGADHMSEIGKRGAASTWSKYTLQPYGFNMFAMVDRETGKIVATHA